MRIAPAAQGDDAAVDLTADPAAWPKLTAPARSCPRLPPHSRAALELADAIGLCHLVLEVGRDALPDRLNRQGAARRL